MSLLDFYNITCFDFNNYFVTVLDVKNSNAYTFLDDDSFNHFLTQSEYKILGSLRVTSFSIDSESCFICIS